MHRLNWIRCKGGRWCSFFNVDITSPHFDDLAGVYVIFYTDPHPTAVRIGQGIIKDRIYFHRDDPKITKYIIQTLLVTWAEVDPSERDGIEVYLAERLHPLVGERLPYCIPIAVNLPFETYAN